MLMTQKHKTSSKYFALAMLLIVSSCGTKKVATNSNSANVATAMALVGNKKLHHFITDWMGVSYRLGGLNKNGIDCSGFALLLQKEVYNKTLPRISKDQALAANKKAYTHLKEGDLIFFSFSGNGVDHVGIYLNNDFFVHASTRKGVIVEDLRLPAYQQTIVKTGSIN